MKTKPNELSSDALYLRAAEAKLGGFLLMLLAVICFAVSVLMLCSKVWAGIGVGGFGCYVVAWAKGMLVAAEEDEGVASERLRGGGETLILTDEGREFDEEVETLLRERGGDGVPSEQ